MAEVLPPTSSNTKPLLALKLIITWAKARFLEKLDLADGKRLIGEKLKQAWFEKIREELNRWSLFPF